MALPEYFTGAVDEWHNTPDSEKNGHDFFVALFRTMRDEETGINAMSIEPVLTMVNLIGSNLQGIEHGTFDKTLNYFQQWKIKNIDIYDTVRQLAGCLDMNEVDKRPSLHEIKIFAQFLLLLGMNDLRRSDLRANAKRIKPRDYWILAGLLAESAFYKSDTAAKIDDMLARCSWYYN